MADNPLSVLQRIRRSPAPSRPKPGEVCDLCAALVPEEHGHVVDLENRGLLCACRACHLLFSSGGAGGTRFRAVPDTYRELEDFSLSPSQWDALDIPVSVAFFFHNSSLGRVAAFYPSPAGATESLLPLDAWDEVVAANPALADLAPDVEAVLLRRGERAAGGECYVVPIDACYELVGTLRLLWTGFDGGAAARDALDEFFGTVRSKAHP